MFFPPRRKPVRERRFLIRTFLQLRRKHVRQSAHRPIPNDWTSCAYLPMKRRRSFRRYFTVSWTEESYFLRLQKRTRNPIRKTAACVGWIQELAADGTEYCVVRRFDFAQLREFAGRKAEGRGSAHLAARIHASPWVTQRHKRSWDWRCSQAEPLQGKHSCGINLKMRNRIVGCGWCYC